MEPELNALCWIAGVTSIAATLIGYLTERSLLSTAMLGGFTAIACGLCCVGMWLAGWSGLGFAVLLVTFLAYRFGKGLGKKRGALFVPGLWLGFCGSCAIGYWARGKLGLLTVTLPSILVFWGSMFWISRYLLPLRSPNQRGSAFRSLFTFSLGTNYPYHVMEDEALVERVPGNPYGQLFAGPGIVLTGPAHAPVLWDGRKFRKVGQPGLTFTEPYETIYQVVDLRPQLRSFYVDATTRDGIRVRVLTFISFKLHAEGPGPDFETSFPLDKDSVYRAVWEQFVEHGQRIAWDRVPAIEATRQLQKIIGRYRCDELCEPFDPDQDPRIDIQKSLLRQLRQELQAKGIEVIGTGISNLLPADERVLENRIEAWQAEWERRIMATLGEGRANAILEIERAHARAQADMISVIREIVEQHYGVDPDVVADMACLRFIEALEEMASSPQVQEALPAEATAMMASLRHVVNRGGTR
jgi:regulator of protease activity HflC (stomatin/prohibitin superfamily)